MFMQVIPTKTIVFKGNNITGCENQIIRLRVKNDEDLHHIIDSLIWSNVWDFQVKKETHSVDDFIWLEDKDLKNAVSP